MNLLYIVRCNFSDASREAAWNDWYSGPKLGQMLSKPYFLSVQRFHRTAGTGRDYLAFWVLSSPEAFNTPEYKNDWGFFEWRPYIIDWSRDLFERVDGVSAMPVRLGADEQLRVLSFEGASEAEAAARKQQVDAVRPGIVWHRSAGLDRHSPLFGIAVSRSNTLEQPVEGAVEGLYRPISELVITPRAEASRLVI